MAIRRRYYLWLVKAYIKKWKKTILTSLLLGGVGCIILITFLNFYFFPTASKKIERIGYWGVYTVQDLPEKILSDVSFGLTKITTSSDIAPGAALRWDIKDKGREYVFYLKKGLKFHNGVEFNSKNFPLQFKDVKRTNIGLYTVDYKLKAPYSPFLYSVSKPIFIDNFQGLGNFTIQKIDTNGGFVKNISLASNSDPSIRRNISFFPTQNALITSFMLGELDKAEGLTHLPKDRYNISSWKTVKVDSKPNYSQLVTIFFDTQDSVLSNKKVRQALSYSLPDKFDDGTRAYSPIPPTSIYFVKSPNYGIYDIDIAKSLISDNSEIKKKELELTTTEDYIGVAKKVVEAWKKIGINCKIKIVTDMPKNFQMFLYQFSIPQDPDQYTLWHSAQVNNISKYKNLRIDKLLEDGRVTTDIEKRKSIYADFQKYLIDDSPAVFLYFPTEYTITRK